MYRKLLLTAVLVFYCITIRDSAPSYKSSLSAPAFDFTKTSYLNKKTKSALTPFLETNKKKDNTVDTAALKQSNWYATVIKNIEASEYEIKKDDKTGSYCGPNRQQQLRASFSYNSFTLKPRSEEKSWALRMQLSGIYVNKKLIAQPGENDLPVIVSNKIVFTNDNFSTEYINSKEGVRQNFIIQKEPTSKPQTINIKLQTDKSWYINKVHDRELHFAKAEGDNLSKKITYNSLKVWDANNKELAAKFVVNKRHTAFEIEVNTTDAVYPVTVDPISTTANWSNESNQTLAYYGWSVASAGDVNGDGYSDIIVGSPTYDNGQTDEGKVFVYHGSATGLSLSANWTKESDQAGAQMGLNANTAGDVNGDGYSDVIIGAPYYDNGQTDEGSAFVFYGSSTGLAATPAWTTESNQASAEYGGSVASAGDINGDGYSDVIVGSPYFDNGNTNEGKAFVYYGSASGLATSSAWAAEGNQDDAYFGGSPNGAVGTGVASAGDVNGDGYSDIIIGASRYDNSNTDEGRVFVYHGSAGGLSVAANWTAESDQDFAYMGNSMASAGDVNGDGYSDVIAGAYTYDNGQSNEGRAYLYYGSATGLSVSANWTAESNVASALFGCSVASAGDVNGDGYSDIIVGASVYTNGQANEGAAFAYFGSATGLPVSYNWMVEGNLSGATLGATLSPTGDVNGDGYSDIVIGAFDYINGQNDEGAAFVYHGSPDGLSASPVNTPDDADQSFARFGVSVASAGDVNGDGYSDVIIGCDNYDDGANNDEGRAFVYHGSAIGLSATPNSILDAANQTLAWFGRSVSSAGDVNGDGYSDVIVGASLYNDGTNTDEGRAFVYHGSATGLSASPDSTPDDADQAFANFGESVASAGDVNGDGYSDVIIGAYNCNDGASLGEGRAFVYYGSSTGLPAVPNNTPDDADQSNAFFGYSVASAGDVNGDGYSDVVIGAYNYDDGANTNEGRAFVYHGSATGLSTAPNNTPDDANQANAYFGRSVSSAGDVNGDGYSDVIIGAHLYDDGASTDEGRAFVYYGSAVGLPATPNSTPDDANQADAGFGRSVASAGDVNGDGYSDVIIGAWLYDDGGNSDEGVAFIYFGSAAGLSASPNSTPDDADQGATFGISVASAGDINGDGYSDVIIGASQYTDGGNSAEGRAFVYYGNNTGGIRNNLRLYNQDLVTPIQQLNVTEPNLFGAGLFSKSPLGRIKAKLVWEVKGQGVAFSGNPITNSTSFLDKQPSFTDLGIAGVELKYNVQKVGSKNNKIRTRVEYEKATAITGQVYGPWRYPAAYLQGAHGMNSIPLPVKLNEFDGSLISGKVNLQWSSSDDEYVATWQVQRSSDNRSFTVIGNVNSVHQNNKDYYFTDTHPLKGTSWYRLKITDEYNRINYSPVIVIKNNSGAVSVYPTVIRNGETINLQFKNSFTGSAEIQLINSPGAVVFKKAFPVNGSLLPVQLPALPPGVYILSLGQNGERIVTQKIILR